MRVLKRETQPRRSRRGFTLIELLVVISIIATLAALILPGIQSAREAARQKQCMNNMRNIGIAIIGDQTETTSSNFPSLQYPAPNATTAFNYGWPVGLLDRLQANPQKDLFDGAPDAATVFANTASNPYNVYLEVFVCPSDVTNSDTDNGFSYRGNAGYISARTDTSDEPWSGESTVGHTLGSTDWTGDGNVTTADRDIQFGTGVFHRPAAGYRMSSTYVETNDGLTQTILLSENNDRADFRSAAVQNVGFGLRVDTASGGGGGGSAYAPTHAADEGLIGVSGAVLRVMPAYNPVTSKINSSGRHPRPRAQHPGTVNVFFCDGRAKAIGENIDIRIWGRLLTPNGSDYGQFVVNDNDY